RVRVPDVEQRTRHIHRQVERGAGGDDLVVEVAAMGTGIARVDGLSAVRRNRRRDADAAEHRASGDRDALGESNLSVDDVDDSAERPRYARGPERVYIGVPAAPAGVDDINGLDPDRKGVAAFGPSNRKRP